MSKNRVWFITGVNRGLGRHLLEAVLQRGDSVAGTARDLSQLDDLRAIYGPRLWLTPLQLGDTVELRRAVSEAHQAFGRLDVVVSNAGYSLLGAAEELEDQAIEDILSINLVASIQLARAVLPLMRAQGQGRLIQISSSSAQTGFAGLSLYCASKWGIEGFYESLAREVGCFGVEVTVVEPGAIATEFASSGTLSPALAAYNRTPAHAFRELLDLGHSASGDPARMAQRIVESVDISPAPFRLVLGSDAFQMVESATISRLEQLRAQRELAYSTDFPVTIQAVHP